MRDPVGLPPRGVSSFSERRQVRRSAISRTDRPVPHVDFTHGKVADVGRGDRRPSPRLCRRTHIAGSSSHSCPESDTAPSADSMSSQRRSSSRPRWISSATKALRLRAPARRSSSATSSSSNAMCMRMGWVSAHKRTRLSILAGHTRGRRAEEGSTALSRVGPSCPALCFGTSCRRDFERSREQQGRERRAHLKLPKSS